MPYRISQADLDVHHDQLKMSIPKDWSSTYVATVIDSNFRLCSSALVYHPYTINTGQELTLERQDITRNDLESENLAQV
jgi:hypothetical protein